jgi:hypothetical protein
LRSILLWREFPVPVDGAAVVREALLYRECGISRAAPTPHLGAFDIDIVLPKYSARQAAEKSEEFATCPPPPTRRVARTKRRDGLAIPSFPASSVPRQNFWRV